MKSIQLDQIKFKIDPISDRRTRLVKQKGNDDLSIPALAEYALELQIPGVVDIVSTDVELLITHSDKLSLITKRMKDIQMPKESKASQYQLPVCFSKGLDWDIVESQTGLKKNKLITMFLKTTFKLEAYGFLPGFMYLTGLPKAVQCLRKSTPRQKVNAGTIALGGQYAGMYNLESPGGWQSIGHCPIDIFPFRQPIGPLLKIADMISFQKISLAEWKLMDGENLTIQDYKVK